MVLGQLVLVLEVLRVQRWQPHSGPSFCGCLGLQVGDRELYGGLALHVERAQEEREEDEAGDAEHEVAAGEKAEAQEGGVGPCGEAARVLAGRREHGGGGGDGGEREDGEGAPGGFEAGVLHWQGRSRSLMVFSSNAQRGAEPPKGALDTRKGLCSHAILAKAQWHCFQSADPSSLGISLRLCRLCDTVRMCLLDRHFKMKRHETRRGEWDCLFEGEVRRLRTTNGLRSASGVNRCRPYWLPMADPWHLTLRRWRGDGRDTQH